MGKLKESIIAEQEQLDSRLYKVSANNDPRISGLDISDEELAQFDKEFNDWLDRYEASFGSNL
jgi:hypothetical protein